MLTLQKSGFEEAPGSDNLISKHKRSNVIILYPSREKSFDLQLIFVHKCTKVKYKWRHLYLARFLHSVPRIVALRALRYKLFFVKALSKRLRKLTIITKGLYYYNGMQGPSGPRKRTCNGTRTCTCMGIIHANPSTSWSSFLLEIVPSFFKISMGEEWSQPTKHANKIIISIFFIMKSTILDTHGRFRLCTLHCISVPTLYRYANKKVSKIEP